MGTLKSFCPVLLVCPRIVEQSVGRCQSLKNARLDLPTMDTLSLRHKAIFFCNTHKASEAQLNWACVLLSMNEEISVGTYLGHL